MTVRRDFLSLLAFTSDGIAYFTTFAFNSGCCSNSHGRSSFPTERGGGCIGSVVVSICGTTNHDYQHDIALLA